MVLVNPPGFCFIIVWVPGGVIVLRRTSAKKDVQIVHPLPHHLPSYQGITQSFHVILNLCAGYLHCPLKSDNTSIVVTKQFGWNGQINFK